MGKKSSDQNGAKESSFDLSVGGTLSRIAKPLADDKLYKKILKTISKGSIIYSYY